MNISEKARLLLNRKRELNLAIQQRLLMRVSGDHKIVGNPVKIQGKLITTYTR